MTIFNLGQFLISSILDHFALVKDDDAVALFDGGHTMSNHDTGSTFHGAV